MVVVVSCEEFGLWRIRVLVKRAPLWGFVLGGAERLGVGGAFISIGVVVGFDIFGGGMVFLGICC